MDAFSGRHPLAAPASVDIGRTTAVLASELTAADGVAYDQFVATSPSGHYSQTRAWARFATAGKPFSALYFLARQQGSVVGAGLVLRTRLGLFPLPIAQVERGPVTAAPEDLPFVLAALRRCCLARGIARLSVMPYWSGDEAVEAAKALDRAEFSDCQRFAGRHARTLRLDLTALDAKNPWNQSSLSKVRQNIGRASRAGATVRRGNPSDIAGFRSMQATLLALEGKSPPHEAWYQAMGDNFLRPGAAMFVCDYEGAPISAICIALHNDMATYAMGASSGRPLRFSKTVLPMTEAILWARSAGARTFDMGGIPMVGDTDPKRCSIAEFKHSYSRTEAHLVHEHVRWL